MILVEGVLSLPGGSNSVEPEAGVQSMDAYRPDIGMD